MVKPQAKRALVTYTRKRYKLSARRACGLFGLNESTWYYHPKERDDAALRKALNQHASANPGWGYRGLMDWLLLEVQHPAFGFYADFVQNIVIPNFFWFAWLIFLTELFVGLSLLTGTVTRLGAFIGLMMSLNLGVGLLEVPGEWPWSYAMLAMFHGIFLFAAPGRLLGVDKWLRDTAFQPLWVRLLT